MSVREGPRTNILLTNLLIRLIDYKYFRKISEIPKMTLLMGGQCILCPYQVTYFSNTIHCFSVYIIKPLQLKFK